MPQKVGTVSTELQLDTRKALQQYNRFQQSVQRGRGRDSLFGAISGDAREFENSLGKATNRVVAFGAAAAIFTAVARATSEFAKSIVEVDKQLAAINVNLGQSADGLKKFGADLFNVARQTGQTFEVAAGAAAELARQGLSAEETTKRLKDALILSRIAGLDSASAVNTLTAAINSFNAEALTSSEVVNKFAAVDTKFAVSSKDLAEAVSRVGSTAQTAGVGLNELIGLVTSLQQTTARGGATIGNGLKTIFTRIQAAPETVNALQGIGVAIKNTDGSLRDGISILKDYASARQKVGEVERQALDRTVAGTFQINVLKALLGDLSKEYSIYGNAVRTATGATDEAARKNEQLNQTIASLLNSTGLSIKQLFSSVGDQSLSGVFKQILQELEGFRSFFSGESGSELGKSLGDGIISGISNVLTGPAITAIWLILLSTFKKVIGTVLQEAGTLLRINGVVQARANIQKQINNLLSQATQAELAQYQAANSVLAKKEQILALEARINQERLAGSAVGNSLLVSGPLRVGLRKDPRLRGGYIGKIPGMANPIASAIAREQKASGLPRKDIYVDRDSRVATFANPMGLLVANRRDEPLGGFQGVNRVIGEGGNPKTAGMGAPNFALTSKETLALQQISSRSGGLEGFVKGLDLSGVNFDVQTAKVRKQILKVIEGSLDIDVSKLAPVARRSYSRLVTEILSERTADISLLKAKQIENRNISTPSQYRVAASLGPLVGSQFSPSPEEVRRPIIRGPDPDSDNYPAQLDRRNPIPRGMYKFSPESKFFRTQEAARLRGIRRERETAKLAREEQRIQTRRNYSLGAAFALPFLAGGIDPLAKSLGINTVGGTTGGVVAGGLSTAAQGAGIGGIFGPAGLAIGAAAGGIVGAFGKITKSASELSQELDTARSIEAQRIDQITAFSRLQEQFNDALESGNMALAKKISDQRDILLRSSTPETRSIIAGAGGGLDDLQRLISSQQNKLQENLTQDNLTKAIKEIRDVGSVLFGGGKDEIKTLASALAAQATSKGINIAGEKASNSAELDAIFKKLGAPGAVAAADFNNKAFFEALKLAQDEYLKNAEVIGVTNKKLKEFEISMVSITSAIRRAQLGDALSGIRVRGGSQRNALRSQFGTDELLGLATANQSIGLRGRLETSQAINTGKEERLQLEEAFRNALRDQIKSASSGTNRAIDETQLERALNASTSTNELKSIAKSAGIAQGDTSTLGKLTKDYEDALSKNIEATKQSVKTISLKTDLEKKAAEIIRRQTSFSQGSLTGGSDAARGLGIIGMPGERTPRKQIAENAALTSFYEQQKALGGDTSALQGAYNTASAKTNLEKFLAEAEATIKSLTLGQGRARDEAGNLSVSAVRQAAGTLSRYRDPNKASAGRYLLDNLQAQVENITAAGAGQNRIKTALSGEQNIRPEEFIKKQLEASTLLQKNLEAFNNAAKDFTININAKVEVLNDNVAQLQGSDFASQLQSQITMVANQVMAMQGKPVPPTSPNAPTPTNRVTAYAPSTNKKLVKGADGYYR